MLVAKNDSRYTTIRTYLIEGRKAKSLRQSDLAEILDVRQQFISKIETAERGIDILEFIELAKALDLDPNEIIKEL